MKTDVCSLYRITAPDGRAYIGIAGNPHVRWKNHKERALRATSKSQYLHQAMKKHGRENFKFEVLLTEQGSGARASIEDAEVLVIELANTLAPHGFNVAIGGTSGAMGHKRSASAKAVNGRTMKKLWTENYEAQHMAIKEASNRPETKARKSNAAKELWSDPEFVAKMMKARAEGAAKRKELAQANAKGAAIQHQTF